MRVPFVSFSLSVALHVLYRFNEYRVDEHSRTHILQSHVYVPYKLYIGGLPVQYLRAKRKKNMYVYTVRFAFG